MGSRGAASGVSAKGIRYGQEYAAFATVDNIKFLKNTAGRVTAPLETMSADSDRVYVTVNNDNVPKYITFYDKSGKKRRQIDLTPHHGVISPHVHIGYNHSPPHPMKKGDWAYYNKVKKAWGEIKK